jgi:hypothetical protein
MIDNEKNINENAENGSDGEVKAFEWGWREEENSAEKNPVEETPAEEKAELPAEPASPEADAPAEPQKPANSSFSGRWDSFSSPSDSKDEK